MKKVRYLAGLAGIVPAAAGVAVPAAAHAATADQGAPSKTVSLRHAQAPAAPAVAHQWSCFDPLSNGLFGWCNGSIIHGPAPFYSHNGAFLFNLHDGDRVKVSCWYKGSTVHGDSYQDHVTRINFNPGSTVPASGHVPDYYVSLGNQTPNNLLRHC